MRNLPDSRETQNDYLPEPVQADVSNCILTKAPLQCCYFEDAPSADTGIYRRLKSNGGKLHASELFDLSTVILKVEGIKQNFLFQVDDIDTDETECILANLIYEVVPPMHYTSI